MSQAAHTFYGSRVQTPARAIARRGVAFSFPLDGFIIMVILAASFLCVSVYRRSSAEIEAARVKHQEAAARVESLRVETERLERRAKQLRTDARALEAEARRALGLVRPGDVVIKIER
ncbi:MAG TPA: septum formation initiator family protein [Blastocatellia bacterium]|nr:septum formation initiator family protein [Blastocatellia bacterium]